MEKLNKSSALFTNDRNADKKKNQKNKNVDKMAHEKSYGIYKLRKVVKSPDYKPASLRRALNIDENVLAKKKYSKKFRNESAMSKRRRVTGNKTNIGNLENHVKSASWPSSPFSTDDNSSSPRTYHSNMLSRKLSVNRTRMPPNSLNESSLKQSSWKTLVSIARSADSVDSSIDSGSGNTQGSSDDSDNFSFKTRLKNEKESPFRYEQTVTSTPSSGSMDYYRETTPPNCLELEQSIYESATEKPWKYSHSTPGNGSNYSAEQIRTSSASNNSSSIFGMYGNERSPSLIRSSESDASLISRYFNMDNGLLLASGAFCRVYKCRSYMDGIIYAVKRYSEMVDERKEQLRVYSILNHKNVERYYACWIDCNNLYVQMELCNGGDLERKLINGHVYSELDIIKLVKHLCRGLKYIHEIMKLVHCNLVASNILISSSVNYDDCTVAFTESRVVYKISGFSKMKKIDECDGGNDVLIGNDLYNLGIIFLRAALGRHFGASHYENGHIDRISKYGDFINDTIQCLLLPSNSADNKKQPDLREIIRRSKSGKRYASISKCFGDF